MRLIDILRKSLKKAEKKGYKSPFDFIYEKGRIIDGKTYYAIIFDKEFCKSIWGEEKMFLPFSNTHQHVGDDITLWSWHLKNMVVYDNPIKYLDDNLDLDTWDRVLESRF